jgi:hypothetical protein
MLLLASSLAVMSNGDAPCPSYAAPLQQKTNTVTMSGSLSALPSVVERSLGSESDEMNLPLPLSLGSESDEMNLPLPLSLGSEIDEMNLPLPVSLGSKSDEMNLP